MRAHDHIDHCRTTQPHAGRWLKNGRGLPGVVVMALGVLAVVSGNAGAAYHDSTFAMAMGVAAVVAFAGGAAWILLEGRRIGRVEVQWRFSHPDGFTVGCLDRERCRYFANVSHPAGHSSFCEALPAF